MPHRIVEDPFSTFAAELSTNLTLITRLLDEHPSEGRCTGCRLPSALAAIRAPCGVRNVAALALRLRAAHELGRAAATVGVRRPDERDY